MSQNQPPSYYPEEIKYNGKKRLYLQGPPSHGATWIRTRETHILPPPPVVELPPPPPPPVIIPVAPPKDPEPDYIDVIAVDVEPRKHKKKHRSRSRSSRREEVYIERERLVPVPVAVPVRERREEYETYRYVEGPKRLPAPSPVRRTPWEEDREVGVHVRISERERERSVEGSDRGGGKVYYSSSRDYYR